jgi:hypothetical protein
VEDVKICCEGCSRVVYRYLYHAPRYLLRYDIYLSVRFIGLQTHKDHSECAQTEHRY